MNEWSLHFDSFDPSQQSLREALCTLGNGYFATRGAAAEASADETHYPATYLAGGYNRLKTEIAGHTIENEDLVNFPNWLCLSFRPLDGDWLNLMRVEILDYEVELYLRHGVLMRRLRYRNHDGQITRLDERRIVHMREAHLCAIQLTITAENWSGTAQVRSALDGRVINAGVQRYRQLSCTHLVPTGQGGGETEPVWLRVQTSQSRFEVAQAARTRLYEIDEPLPAERTFFQEPGHVGEEFSFTLRQGEPVSVEKIVALHSSRDMAISEPATAAREAVQSAPRHAELEASHAQAWEDLWRRVDITLTNTHLQRPRLLLRFHTFHMLQTISPNVADIDAGVPARGLHGEAYRGHVFWDELYVFPFFNYRFPHIARTLLEYRYRRLPKARQMAEQAGLKGAMFPWQSGSDGREESQRLHLNPKSGRWLPDNTHLQRHVSAAVAYNTWQHYEATLDRRFLEDMGAEILIEVARLWASLANWNESRERYELHGVMGPDEYHDAYPGAQTPGIDNNAYTNVMAVWCLRTALKALEVLSPGHREVLRARLGLEDEETALWRDISRKMFVPISEDGIISQFEGYDDLREFDWDGYRAKYGDIQRLDRILEAEGDTPNRYKVSKQADVLMLFYLFSAAELKGLFDQLGYEFDTAWIQKNIDYYLVRTSHGSTLSRIIHAWVMARSNREASWKLLLEALESDVSDIQHGTTAEGIHLGAMAATVDMVLRGYTGMALRDDQLHLDPCLPKNLFGLSYRVFHQGNWLTISIQSDTIQIAADRYTERNSHLKLRDRTCEIKPGQTLTLRL